MSESENNTGGNIPPCTTHMTGELCTGTRHSCPGQAADGQAPVVQPNPGAGRRLHAVREQERGGHDQPRSVQEA